MLEAALKEIEKYLNPEKEETIADLYCGIGTFGIAFSRYAKEIIGIESSPDNISFLKSNLKLNNINLSTSLGSPLVGAIYILDEPSIGLHQSDSARLITLLRKVTISFHVLPSVSSLT